MKPDALVLNAIVALWMILCLCFLVMSVIRYFVTKNSKQEWEEAKRRASKYDSIINSNTISFTDNGYVEIIRSGFRNIIISIIGIVMAIIFLVVINI